MSNDLKIKADKDSLLEYMKKFERGELQVPAFQRDFVWNNEKKLELFDSIKKGYPIGTILLWQPKFNKDEIYKNLGSENIGSYKTPERTPHSFYIIDGFQRLSTLIGCLLHPEKAKRKGIIRDEKEWVKNFNIVYNIKDEAFEMNRSKNLNKLDFFQIPIYKLIDGKEFFKFQKELHLKLHDEEIINKYIENYEEMSLMFQQYEIPNINIYGGTIAEAIDIFQRLNSTGARITADWVVSAKSFGKDQSFRLATEIENLLDIDLSIYNFQKLKREVILQCIANSFGEVYFDKFSRNKFGKLEEMVERDDFISTTRKVFEAIQKAVKFLYEELYVLNSKLLPYNSQLIFITDFFTQIINPSQLQIAKLKKWFWITTYTNYFTVYNLSKQRLAYNQFQDFLHDDTINPVYYDEGRGLEAQQFPEKITMGNVRAKALALFMLKYQAKSEKLDTNTVDGLKTYRLFSKFENKGKSANFSENTILIINDSSYSINKSQKDFSAWLNTDEDLNSFFITHEMKNVFRNTVSKGLVEFIDKILQIRKSEIQKEEKKFIKSLGVSLPRYKNTIQIIA